jgi:branched-chain amino acid transport system substrate-binding protein
MEIKVGCCLSLTGSFAPLGQQAERGLRLWVEDVNAAGGLLVRDRRGSFPLDFVVRDDGSRASRAARLAGELIDADQVDLVVGPYSSTVTLAVATVAESHRKVLWNHGGSSDALVQRGFRYVVNLPSPASKYFVGVLDLARALSPALRRLFVASGPAGTFAPSVIGGAEDHARRNDFQVVGRSAYPTGGDFTALVAEIVVQRPDVLLGAGRAEADVALARALRAESVTVPIVGLVAAGVADFGTQLGRSADGFYGPSQWESSATTRPDVGPDATEFTARFRARFGIEPEYPAAQAYAAGLVIQRCLELAGTLRDDALREAANTLRFRTFYGDFRLDLASGEQVGHSMVIVQWQQGAKRVVWPPAVAEAAPI